MSDASQRKWLQQTCTLFIQSGVQLLTEFTQHAAAWANASVIPANFSQPNHSLSQLERAGNNHGKQVICITRHSYLLQRSLYLRVLRWSVFLGWQWIPFVYVIWCALIVGLLSFLKKLFNLILLIFLLHICTYFWLVERKMSWTPPAQTEQRTGTAGNELIPQINIQI